MIYLGIALAVLCGALLGGQFFLDRYRKHLALQRALNAVLFRVSLPRVFPVEEEKRKKPEKELIAVMEQLYMMFSRLRDPGKASSFLGPPHITLELAVPAVGEEIVFYVAAPKHFADEVQKAIHSIYETAHVEPINDYNIFHPYGVAAGAVMNLERHHCLPLKTYQQLESDPLQPLATALSKLAEEGEGAAIQLLVRPAPLSKRRFAQRIARHMQRTGHDFYRSKRELSWKYQLYYAMRPAMSPHNKKNQQNPMHSNVPLGDPTRPYSMVPMTPFVQETIKSIETKASKLQFEVNVRILAAAPDVFHAEEIAGHIALAMSQYDAPHLNAPRIKLLRKNALKKLTYLYSFRVFDKGQAIILNTEELTSLYHFPNVPLEAPKVKFLKAKPAPPPANMPKDGIILGRNIYRGIETKVRLSVADRRRHLYVIGQTGTGKTTFLRELIRQDIEAGHGIAVIDPHGDLAESVLSFVPRERAGDVVIFDPADIERPPGLNMLEAKTPGQKDFAVQEMIRIFEKLFPPEVIGPMFEHNMRNAMLTLMADPERPGTIVEIPRIFTDDAFARSYVQKLTDPIVRAFWEKEMAKTTDFHRSEMLGYLISKVGRFVENTTMRNIIGQAQSSFDIRDIMDTGKIFIANLSKGKLGEVNASLLGLTLVSKMQMAALARADVPESQRKDFYLYIDEFQNFTTDSIATILSEARKYKLNLIIAHQFIAQLKDEIREAVFGNVGSIAAFRVGPKDAEFLVKQFAPIFTEEDLVNVDNYHAYARLMINNVSERPFNIESLPPTPSDPSRIAALFELSRLRFGRPKAEVEAEILERSQLGLGPHREPTFVPGERNM